MSGSFSTISTALSALQYSRVALDVSAGNVANVGTEGYARRRVEAQSVGAAARPAMWSRSETAGNGVVAGGLTRMVDPFLDARARNEHGAQSNLDATQSALERLESGISEPGDTGVSAAMAELRQGWNDLANTPSSDAARNQVLARAGTLAQTLGAQARNVTTEAANQRTRAQALVSEVNTVTDELASANEAIAVARLGGGDADALLDQRDVLAMRLAELTGARATAGAQGGLDITVNGLCLVTGGVAGRLELASGIAADGSADGSPVTFRVVDPSGGTSALPAGLGGELGAGTELLNNTLPDYLSGLDEVARSLADAVNAQHGAGYDAAGSPGQPLFAYDATRPAATLSVALTDPADVAAAGLPGGVLDGSNAQLLGSTSPAEAEYQRLVNSFGTDVASVRRLAANQQVLTDHVDGTREELSGVSLDEEMLTMLTHQRAYEAAAKVLATVDSVLDTLINRTGLLR